MLSRLDYGNATLVGLSANLLNRLQSVLNAAAQSVAGLRQSDHITDTFASFHWLRAPERIMFKLAVIVYPEVFTALHLGICRICCAALLTSNQDTVRLRSSTSSELVIPLLRLVTAFL